MVTSWKGIKAGKGGHLVDPPGDSGAESDWVLISRSMRIVTKQILVTL